MFIKRNRGGSENKPIYYIQIAENYRQNGKIRQRILANLGREDELTNSNKLDSIINTLSDISRQYITIHKSKDPEAIKSTYILGTSLVIDKLWNVLSLDKVFSRIKKKHKTEFDFVKAVKLMILNRICDPKSKLGIIEWKKSLYPEESYKGIELQHLYRSLDILSNYKENIEENLYEKSINLFKIEVQVVFYDLTTVYFESQEADGFRMFGYSKDNKTDSVQIIIGLIISEDGIPLGYEIFPGNPQMKVFLFKLIIRNFILSICES